MDASLAENGPYYVDEDGELAEREYAWDVTSNIIFVDSPINVGYSYSDDPRDRVLNETVLAADLLDFLEEFLQGAVAAQGATVAWLAWRLRTTCHGGRMCPVCPVSALPVPPGQQRSLCQSLQGNLRPALRSPHDP